VFNVMAVEGVDAKKLFGASCYGYNLDDLTVVPGFGNCALEQANLETRFSRSVSLRSPIVSAPMRAVTEGRMALAMALSGGIGVIHCNCSPEAQAKEVKFVKNFSHGFIMNPQVLGPTSTLHDLEKLKATSDCSSALITEGGCMGNKLLGIVTARDADFVKEKTTKLLDIMIPKEKMVVAKEPIKLSEAIEMLQETKVSRLPVVNDAGELAALVTRSDMKRNRDHPLAAKDANLQPVVAACVNPAAVDGERVRRLVEAGADAIVIDGSECDTQQQQDFIKRVRRDFPSIDVVAGPVATTRLAKALLDAGADGLRVSTGASSGIRAVGRPLGSAVYHVARFVRENFSGVPVIADGCVETSHHISMLLALGASTVMCGSVFAGTRESPGDAFLHNGMRLKINPGPHCLTPEAPPSIACAAVDRGPVTPLVTLLIDGLRRDLSRFGVAKLDALHEDLKDGKTKFQVRSAGAFASALGGR
jgi:IMP dehydrogenase